ncbi:hypothetical protein SRHO_G00189490 [Serrasalmus rhombeus]
MTAHHRERRRKPATAERATSSDADHPRGFNTASVVLTLRLVTQCLPYVHDLDRSDLGLDPEFCYHERSKDTEFPVAVEQGSETIRVEGALQIKNEVGDKGAPRREPDRKVSPSVT